MGLLTQAEVDEVLISEFNPVRVGFKGFGEIVTIDVLNCGASPKILLEIVKSRFLQAGGYVCMPTLASASCKRVCCIFKDINLAFKICCPSKKACSSLKAMKKL